MLVVPRMRNRWWDRGAVGRWASRPSRRRAGPGWTVEPLEGRTLLSTYTVVSPGDSGTGTLRWAIDQANQDPGNDTISFSSRLAGQTITLTSGLLPIRKASGSLTIRGPAAGPVTISGNSHSEVFNVAPVATATISGLTITGGICDSGGGLFNNGNLTLTDDTLSGNSARGGGGGGIANGPYGTLMITDSTLSGNSAFLASGGGLANQGSLTILSSTISGNSVLAANGGGLANQGSLTIINSTISGNSATGSAGGIENLSSLTMADDTVADNSASGPGGGIDNEAFSGGYLTLSNTIVADNSSTNDLRTNDLLDNADLDQNHLVGQCDLVGAGDLGSLDDTMTGVNPDLGPLQNNGGPTQTMALLAGSPAINAGDNAAVPAGIRTDQRGPGYSRFVDGRVDIGAFEFQGDNRVSRHGGVPPRARNQDVVGADIGLTVVGDDSGTPQGSRNTTSSGSNG
jgi:hypothetical protein